MDWLAQLEKMLIAALPAEAEALAAVIAEFRQMHPELGTPPPADEEATVNADIDAQLKASER